MTLRRCLLSSCLASTFWLTSCAQSDMNSFIDSASDMMDDFGDSAMDTLRPVIGTGAQFVTQVIRRGCGDSPFVGASPVETLALTTSFVASATTGYTEGIQIAQKALKLQVSSNKSLINDLDALKGGVDMSTAFTGFRMIEQNSEDAEALEAALDARMETGEPLSDEVLADLREATRSMQIGTHFQVDAAVGLIMLSAYFADAWESGGAPQLVNIMRSEFNRMGGESMLNQLQQSPMAVASLAMNFMSAYRVQDTLSRVTDFDEVQRDAASLGITDDLSVLEGVAVRQASLAESRYPGEQLNYKPSGAMVRDMMVRMMQQRGVNPMLAQTAINGAMSACQGAFGTSGGETLQAAAPLTRSQVVEAQTILANMNYLNGGADGVAGQQTVAAVRAFQRDQGMPQTGELDGALLNRLRGASGTGTPVGVNVLAGCPGSNQPPAALQGLLGGLAGAMMQMGTAIGADMTDRNPCS